MALTNGTGRRDCVKSFTGSEKLLGVTLTAGMLTFILRQNRGGQCSQLEEGAVGGTNWTRDIGAFRRFSIAVSPHQLASQMPPNWR